MDGVTADGERFDERALLGREFVRRMQFASWEDEALGHAAVHHHAEHFEAFAAVAVALATGMALLAVHVGLHRATISHLHVGYA